MRALERKVLREVRLLWSQALTIGLVVASGVAGFLAMLSAVDSLAQARDAFYASGRFADVFAGVHRAPDALAARLRALDGVLDVQTTVEAGARISVPTSSDPVMGTLVGLDARQPRRLNLLQLRSGRWPQADLRGGSEIEAVVAEGFAQAHRLRPGDKVGALLNGTQRTLRLTGTALSPEFIFGGLLGVPDLRAFGVFWVDKDQLAAAADMRGAFNRVALKLAPGASAVDVQESVTRVLLPLGGVPAHGRDEQASHAMLENEIREQSVLGTVLPAIFLGVAGFLLHVVAARLVATQREQVATLKALGYGNADILRHYVLLLAPMVLGGFLLGLLLGDWLGGMLTGLYAEFFRFPRFDHHMPAGLVALAFGLVAATAVLGTLTAVMATVRLSPAEAMRPPAPGHYRRALLERLPHLPLGAGVRMVLRNLERRPLRTLVTVGGTAVAIAIVIMGNFFRDAIASIIDVQFNVALRGDVVVWMVDPVNASAARGLARLPGVLQVEPGRRVGVRFVHGPRSEKSMIEGDAAPPVLQRLVDVDGRQVPAGTSGLVLTDRLADKLGVRPGDWVTVEVREGRREVREVRVEGTVRNMMGMNAWMERGALNTLLAEGDVASFFTLYAERGRVPALLAALQQVPRVAGAFSKATMLRNMREISARNVLIMSSILTVFAAVIAVGVVYNNARIALAERSWELASLRVLGFTRGEVSAILLGELALCMAAALPLGMALGWGLTHLITGMLRSDQFLFPVVIQPRTYALAALAVVAAGLGSALVVRRRIDRLDMVAALKTRE
ncbi:MAG: ABC transporter permease [Ramlibacter sp.]